MNIRDVLNKASFYLKEKDLKKIMRSYELAEKIYGRHTTAWGVPYAINYLDSAMYLLELAPDADTLCACFLQKAPAIDPDAPKYIRSQIGDTVARLVVNLNQVITLTERSDTRQGLLSKPTDEASKTEALRKMFLAISRDLRVILIRLAEKMNRLDHISLLEKEVRKPYAREVMEIFVPIAERLGIFHFKRRLEDLCFMKLEEKNYHFVKSQFDKSNLNHSSTLERMKMEIYHYLREHRIKVEIEGRIKGYYSSWMKMKEKNFSSIDRIQDLYAVRVVVRSKEDCYRVLGLIHSRWQPLSERFKDYIAAPKINGYRSLHTTVVGIAPEYNNRPVEIQIRTGEMHREAQFGIAAHWWYKENATDERTGGAVQDSAQRYASGNIGRVEWVKNLMDLRENLLTGNSRAYNLDFFSDRIFVLTPGGEVRDLPKGATVLDFAYEIHTDVGNHCVRAKINGENVPLDYELQNGDVVDILTDPKKLPNRYWLSIVKTARAREKIRSWIKSLRRQDSVKEGRNIFNRHLRMLGMPELDPDNTILKHYSGRKLNVRQREELLEEIGRGKMAPGAVLKQLFPDHAFFRRRPKSTDLGAISSRQEQHHSDILVTGQSGFDVREARCCNPKPGDSIVGYTTRGGIITIHTWNCRVLKSLSKNRIISVGWKGVQPKIINITLMVHVERQTPALFRQLGKVVEYAGCVMRSFHADAHKEGARITMDISVPEYDKIDLLVSKLEYCPGVESVEVSTRENLPIR